MLWKTWLIFPNYLFICFLHGVYILMCLSWNILFLHQFWKITLLGIAFFAHTYLLSELEIYYLLFFLTIRTVGRSEVILIVLPLCVSCHFSHTTFSIVPLICIFDILIMCLTEIFIWWILCRVLNISSICMFLGLGSFLL